MADRRKLNQVFLAKDLSGKETARLVLQNYMDEQAGKQPTFSEADLEWARATLRGRPEEAAVYNAWIEVARIVDYTSLEAIGKALEAEKRLVWVVSSILDLLRQGLLRHARQRATQILTPAEWALFPARREQARRARMAEEKVSFAEVMRGRAWWLAPDELKARARALPDFDDGGNAYDDLLRLDTAAAQQLRRAATAEIVELVTARKLRFVRDGKNVSSKLRAGKCLSTAGEATDLAAEAECTLLELVEAGLPEWVEQGAAEDITPSEFRGPVAVLQDAPPEYLDGQGQFVDPGWQQIEDQLRRALRPDKLQALQEEIAACQLFIRVFLAREAVIDVFSQELDLDLFIPQLRGREQAIRELLAMYNRQATMSWDAEPDEDGFVLSDDVLPLPRGFRLPLIDVAKLEPDPAEVELMRQSLATPLVGDWWEAADQLGICGALGALDPDNRERLRQRGRELGSINLAFGEVRGEAFHAGVVANAVADVAPVAGTIRRAAAGIMG